MQSPSTPLSRRCSIPGMVRLLSGLLLVPLLLLCGCEDSDSDSDSDAWVEPEDTWVGADLAGSWAGTYYTTDGIDSEPITATITQDGDAVTIWTSLIGTGGLFTGTIDEEGFMVMMDNNDGQTWTTIFGATTSNELQLVDLLLDRFPLGGSYPYAVIHLTR